MKDRKNKGYIYFAVGLFTGIFSGIIMTLLVVLFLGASYLGYGDFSEVIDSKNLEVSDTVDNSIEIDIKKVNKKIQEIQGIIQNDFLFQANEEKIEEGIYKGLMEALEDPYSVYYTKEEKEILTEDTQGIYFGIGAMLSQDPENKRMKIIKVFSGSPSEKAGLMIGDIIYKVNDIEVLGMDSNIVINQYIKGPENTDVKITVLRGENFDEVELTITRKKIEVPTVEYRMLEDGIGYLNINQFDVVTASQFKSGIENLKEQGMQKLIIDLRNNPGGVLSTTVDMLDYILPDGLLVYTADKNGYGNKFYSDDGKELGLELVVLTNENSASASELFAGSIKDFSYGKIIGKNTFGKGVVQNFMPLSDGTAIKITTQYYYTASGNQINKVGIAPDIEVDLDKDALIGTDTDNQLQAAIKELK